MMKLLRGLIYLYLILKPFYFFQSGVMQIGDFVFLFAFIIYILLTAKNKDEVRRTIRVNSLYLLFLFFVIVINAIYAIYYLDTSFIWSSLYYLYNFLIIIVFTTLLRDNKFILNIDRVIKINLIVQLIIYLAGIGQYWHQTYRYMGTFNDPNQFAYFILISYCFIYIINRYYNKKSYKLIFLLISLILISKSASTGMLLGIAIVCVLDFVNFFKSLPSILGNRTRTILKLLFVISIIIMGTITIAVMKPEYKYTINSFFSGEKIINRVNQKIAKGKSDNGDSLIHDRGYDTIIEYPYYMIFGAGQGYYSRFSETTGHNAEIHATFPSILFYYGIIPFMIIVMWVYKKLKKIDSYYYVAYLALFIESFTLLNQRQSLFWIIILLAYAMKNNHSEINKRDARVKTSKGSICDAYRNSDNARVANYATIKEAE